jgi:hypothetical protein
MQTEEKGDPFWLSISIKGVIYFANFNPRLLMTVFEKLLPFIIVYLRAIQGHPSPNCSPSCTQTKKK